MSYFTYTDWICCILFSFIYFSNSWNKYFRCNKHGLFIKIKSPMMLLINATGSSSFCPDIKGSPCYFLYVIRMINSTSSHVSISRFGMLSFSTMVRFILQSGLNSYFHWLQYRRWSRLFFVCYDSYSLWALLEGGWRSVHRRLYFIISDNHFCSRCITFPIVQWC